MKNKQPININLDTVPDGAAYSRWSIPVTLTGTNVSIASGAYHTLATINLPPGVKTRANGTFLMMEVFVLWSGGMSNTNFDVRWTLKPSSNVVAIVGARVDNGQAGSMSAVALAPNVDGDNQLLIEIYQNTGMSQTVSSFSAWDSIQNVAT